jgi:hypothetical protein
VSIKGLAEWFGLEVALDSGGRMPGYAGHDCRQRA